MKCKYTSPLIQVEELEKPDVLLSSPLDMPENNTQKFSNLANKSLTEWGFSDNI